MGGDRCDTFWWWLRLNLWIMARPSHMEFDAAGIQTEPLPVSRSSVGKLWLAPLPKGREFRRVCCGMCKRLFQTF